MKTTESPKFIVTGGAGFIGSNLVAALNARGLRDIVIVDELDSDLKKANLQHLRYRKYLDLADFRAQLLDNRVNPVAAVFHLGACSSTTETREDYLNDHNVVASKELCEWSLKNNARFIYASSAATYGNGARGYSDDDEVTPTLRPLNLYGQSKLAFDLWALANGHLNRIVGLKYFNVYGPREDHKGDMRSVVNKAYGQILETGRLDLFKSYRREYGDGEQDRDFVHVRDAVYATLFFYEHPQVAGLFNCGTGTARTWLDLAKAVFAAMNRRPKIRFIEMPESIRENYQYHTQADVSKLRRVGYTAPFISLEEGVKDYVRNYLATRDPM